MQNKRGMSDVVTTLIVILLVLVAVGIVWVVVSNVLESGAEQTEISSKCLGIDIRATSLSCDGNNCSVSYTRKDGNEAVDGVKIVVTDGTDSNETIIPGTMGSLAVRTSNVTYIKTANEVVISGYFLDSSNEPVYCSPSYTYRQ